MNTLNRNKTFFRHVIELLNEACFEFVMIVPFDIVPDKMMIRLLSVARKKNLKTIIIIAQSANAHGIRSSLQKLLHADTCHFELRVVNIVYSSVVANEKHARIYVAENLEEKEVPAHSLLINRRVSNKQQIADGITYIEEVIAGSELLFSVCPDNYIF